MAWCDQGQHYYLNGDESFLVEEEKEIMRRLKRRYEPCHVRDVATSCAPDDDINRFLSPTFGLPP